MSNDPLTGVSLHPGEATGDLLVLGDGLSFYGGVDHEGTITAVRHPQDGVSVVGRVVALPTARGSSSSASVVAELIRAGVAPAALLLVDLDTILVVGALVAAELYGHRLPIAHITRDVFERLGSGTVDVTCDAAGDAATILRCAV
ncbi:MAG: putative aconitase subunit 2 [Ilumatobacteraceae bacterium]|nr:putative aconitase subunit 2 [Ilumatobacteraceae bacterium]